MRLLILSLLCLLVTTSLCACQGSRLNSTWSSADAPQPRQPLRPGEVNLTAGDLAGVDAYLGARNSQWILGDTVDVFASREYFAQTLTMNAKVGLVHRKDEKLGDDTLVTMTYIGHPGSASAMSNPRVQIGTGLTVTARRTLRVRLAKTRDRSRPVQLRVVAHGDASRGRQEQILKQGQRLEIGGVLRRSGGRWTWGTMER